MTAKPLRPDLHTYLVKHNLVKKFNKQLKLFLQDPNYPSLNTEILEPRSLRIYSFRIDSKYRAIFISTEQGQDIEIIDINDHYQ